MVKSLGKLFFLFHLTSFSLILFGIYQNQCQINLFKFFSFRRSWHSTGTQKTEIKETAWSVFIEPKSLCIRAIKYVLTILSSRFVNLPFPGYLCLQWLKVFRYQHEEVLQYDLLDY